MGKLSRTKGHSFEREVAIAFRVVYPETRRHLEYQDAEANGCDLINTGPYKIQCKRLRNYAPINRISEVEHDALAGEVPILVTRGDNSPALAVLPLDELIRLLAKVHGTR